VVVSAGDLEICTAVEAENHCWKIAPSDHVGANVAALHEGKMLTDLHQIGWEKALCSSQRDVLDRCPLLHVIKQSASQNLVLAIAVSP